MASWFFVGQNVTFKDSSGREVQGTIQKINPKSIMVETRQGTWKVSPSLVSKISPLSQRGGNDSLIESFRRVP